MTAFQPDASHAEEEEPGRECDGWSVGPAQTIRGRPDRPTMNAPLGGTFAASLQRVGEVRARCVEFAILRLQFVRQKATGPGMRSDSRAGRWLVGQAARNLWRMD